ncbi:hypothetical protein [Pseudomonas sp. NPDC087817]|uniref:hypothetical protein n=1 Tax=Pseudomonas sp. NPDC087817 TaxID=3364451 RepID=UPI0038144A88
MEDDLQGIIPAWFNMNIGDKAEVFWGNANSAVWSKTLDLDIELNKDLSFTIPKAHVLDGEAKPVFYRITYKNQTSEDSKPELILLVKLTRPGEYDDIPGDDGHSDLKFSLDHDEVDQNLPAKGVTMRIVPYRNLTRYDRILARWGSQQVTHVVTPEQAQDPVRHPIDVVFSRAVIETAGDGPEVAVAYQVVDRCGNYPDERAPWSAIRKVLVDLGGNRLDVPLVLVKGQPANSINLDQLGDDDVEVLVNTPAADFKVGDKVFLTWTGTPAQGSQIIVGPLELPVAVVSFPLKFPIPNASVRAIAKGSASVGYICQRSGIADRPSKNASVPVIGEISQLRAPTVDEAPGGTLPPETPWATVNIPWYPGRNSSDLINLIWQAQAPGGSTVYYEDPRPVGDIAENQPVQRNVSNAEIRRFNGLNVKVFYTVTNSETALLSVRESLVFPMQVGVALPTFDRPEVEGADNDVLDPDKVPPLGATLVVPYLGTRDKDRVTWRWRGSASGGSTSGHIDLIPATAGKPVRITVNKQYVTANLNGTVVADYSIQRAGATVGNSHELTLRIGAALGLDAPKIKEANGSTSLNPLAAKDSLTAIVDYTGMAIGDDIVVTWTGTTPNGSDTSAKKTVTTLGPQSIELKKSVVAFNLGKAVTVSYTVTRGGAPVPSKVLPLTVLTIPHEHAQLPKATIDGASNDDLDVTALANASTRVAAWPLIAANQKIWLRYSGTKADGSEYKKTTYEGETLRGDGVIVGPYPATPVAELRGLKDNSTLKIEFKVTFDGSPDEAKAVTFPPRVYKVKAVQDVKPVISTVKDSKGEDIPHNGGTVDPKIKLTGTAAPLQEVEVFEGAATKGKHPVNAGGIWTCEITLAGIATRTFTAKAQYGTGQVSVGRILTLSNAIKPSVTSVKDSTGIEIPSNGKTYDNTLKLTGGGTPRLKVEIFDGPTSKGIAEVRADNGRWELEVKELNAALHSFTAKALYAPGEISAARTLTVMTRPELIVDPSLLRITGYNISIEGSGLPWVLTGVDPIGTAFDRSAEGGVPPYIYESLDERIASVDRLLGIVRSQGNGRTTIRVRDQANQIKEFPVTVSNVAHYVSSNNQKFNHEEYRAWAQSVGAEPIPVHERYNHMAVINTKFSATVHYPEVWWHGPIQKDHDRELAFSTGYLDYAKKWTLQRTLLSAQNRGVAMYVPDQKKTT